MRVFDRTTVPTFLAAAGLVDIEQQLRGISQFVVARRRAQVIEASGGAPDRITSGSSYGRNPEDQDAGTDVKEISRRRRVFGGEKEQLLQVIVNVGTFYLLTVPAERRAEVDALIAELEKARDGPSS